MQNSLFCGFNQWESGVYFGPLFVLFKTLLGALTNSAMCHFMWNFLQKLTQSHSILNFWRTIKSIDLYLQINGSLMYCGKLSKWIERKLIWNDITLYKKWTVKKAAGQMKIKQYWKYKVPIWLRTGVSLRNLGSFLPVWWAVYPGYSF